MKGFQRAEPFGRRRLPVRSLAWWSRHVSRTKRAGKRCGAPADNRQGRAV